MTILLPFLETLAALLPGMILLAIIAGEDLRFQADQKEWRSKP